MPEQDESAISPGAYGSRLFSEKSLKPLGDKKLVPACRKLLRQAGTDNFH